MYSHNSAWLSKKYLWLGTFIALLAGPGTLQPAAAATQAFTGSASTTDGPLGASASFATTTGLITITLANTLTASQIGNAAQALSDLQFTLSNAPGTQGTLTAAGQLANIGSGGSVTDVSGSPVRFIGKGPPPPNGTGTFTVTGSTILMEALGGGQPSQMILPSGGPFTSGNASITNGMFSPFTVGPATFTLAFSGITTATTVSAVQFSFGTGPDHTIPGTLVPLPQALPLFVTGLVGLGLLGRRRKKKLAG